MAKKPKYHDKTHFNKNIDELRERQIESQQKLHKYLDEMFEKEQRDKERQQKYLHLKKLESQQYLKLAKLEALQRHKSKLDPTSAINVDPVKLKRADEFFRNLQSRDLGHRNNSLPKLDPKKNVEIGKNRVKWQDSEMEARKSTHNLFLAKNNHSSTHKHKYSGEEAKRDSFKQAYKPNTHQKGYNSDAYLSKSYESTKRIIKDRIRGVHNNAGRHKIHSQKVTIRSNRGSEQRYSSSRRGKVLEITFRGPKEGQPNDQNSSSNKKRTIELCLKYKNGSKKDLIAATKHRNSKDFEPHEIDPKVYKTTSGGKHSSEERCKSVLLKNKKDGTVQLHLDINKRKDHFKASHGKNGQPSVQFKNHPRGLDREDLSKQLPKKDLKRSRVYDIRIKNYEGLSGIKVNKSGNLSFKDKPVLLNLSFEKGRKNLVFEENRKSKRHPYNDDRVGKNL
eukprot:CAMPEP_0197014498 /NCGR_PEP_ID=MMETSP1380-20130617/70564_1 /TAXON_ID=5936 /ORGANISM="Euplotes crassus, Strain CT5" /LENGTH=448 /DNA_ID=CAMNT_0042439613 /DNA_START=146 /DNA_END=1493 /DNA_ORIENTATION=-